MKVHTDYLWFNTKKRQEFVRITDDVAAIVSKSGITEGMVLVSAMHITAAVYVNDWEDGLIHDFQVWLEKLAPAGLDYRHIPIAGSFPAAQVEAMAKALEEGPVLAFCRSGTRSTWLWALARSSRGAEAETLIAQAADAGFDLSPLARHLRR